MKNLEGLVNRDIKLSFFFFVILLTNLRLNFRGLDLLTKLMLNFDRGQKKLPKSEFVYDHVKW